MKIILIVLAVALVLVFIIFPNLLFLGRDGILTGLRRSSKAKKITKERSLP
ncbi:hypothetical protein KJ866_04230 [Patescibacteria group bacterium]|nr:hypothetical protein [Patescibacteria group bacterium]